MALCSLVESNEEFESAKCSHPKVGTMKVQNKVPHISWRISTN